MDEHAPDRRAISLACAAGMFDLHGYEILSLR